MEPRSIESYGGPYANEGAVENPETQMDSSYGNRLLEDAAQLTRPATRAVVVFDTTAVAGPYVYAASAISIRTVWGSGTGNKPTVTKTATGRYTVAFASSYNDGLGEAENVGFFDGFVVGRGATVTDVPSAKLLTLSATTATIATMSSGVLADALASTDPITVSVWLL